MSRSSGVSSSTCVNMIIDAGEVFQNYGLASQTSLGATRGGSTFKVEVTQKDIGADGLLGPTKCMKRITEVKPTLVVNFLEHPQKVWDLANPTATVSDYPATVGKTHNKYTFSRDLLSSDYVDNIAIVGDTTASPTGKMIIILKNTLADSNFELAMADKEETVLPVTFVAHFDPDDVDTWPFEMLNPIGV